MTPEQRAEMIAFVDEKQPGLLDELGIPRELPRSVEDFDAGVRAGLDYARQFLGGASAGAQQTAGSQAAAAARLLTAAADELGRVTPDHVRGTKRIEW